MAVIDIYEVINPNVPNISYYLLQVFNIKDIKVKVIYHGCHSAEYYVNIYHNGFTYNFQIYISGKMPSNLSELLPYILLSRNPYNMAVFSENTCHWYCKLFTCFDCFCFSSKQYLMSWKFVRPLGELAQ